MFILDTMVVSERTKLRPDTKVYAWLNALEPKSQFISVVSIGEIRYGIERLPPSANRRRLQVWYNDLIPFFKDRILPIDMAVADHWGRLRHRVRRSVSVGDSLIAATAHLNNLAVATRNVADFSDFGVRVVNPWA